MPIKNAKILQVHMKFLVTISPALKVTKLPTFSSPGSLFATSNLSSKNSYQMFTSKVNKPNKWEAMGHTGLQHNRNSTVPKKVAEGELYARYSLLEHQAGNSLCFSGHVLSPSSSLFHGNTVSVAVGVVTLAQSAAAEEFVPVAAEKLII